MRLAVLDRGHGWVREARLRIARLLGRPEPNPMTKAVSYRPELFGEHWLRLVRAVLHGPSDWSVGERELLGAFVSRLNSCPFCAGFHRDAAVRLLGPGVVELLEQEPPDGSGSRIAAALRLLEKATLTPDDVDRADVQAARAAGLSDLEIRDALYVCFVFNAASRFVNALSDG